MKKCSDKICEKSDSNCSDVSTNFNEKRYLDDNQSSEYSWEIKEERSPIKKYVAIVAVIIAVIIAAAATVLFSGRKNSQDDIKTAKIDTISTLQKIVNVSKLSTVKFVYNGVAVVGSDDKTDYHVSYNSTVSIGVDFDKVTLENDPEAKKIYVMLPSPEITDISVDINSLDFIFTNKKANTLSVTQTAYEKCIEDVRAECEADDKIFDIAQKNIEDTIRALTQPIIDDFFDGYELEFVKG